MRSAAAVSSWVTSRVADPGNAGGQMRMRCWFAKRASVTSAAIVRMQQPRTALLRLTRPFGTVTIISPAVLVLQAGPSGANTDMVSPQVRHVHSLAETLPAHAAALLPSTPAGGQLYVREMAHRM